MAESSKEQQGVEEQQAYIGWFTPLEGDVVPLEDIEEGDKPVTVVTLIGKV